MRPVKRVVALLSTTAVLAGGLALAAPAAFAMNPAGAVINPASGTDTTALGLVTDGACAAGTNFLVRVFGSGFPAAGFNVVGNTPLSAASRTSTGGYSIPITQTMATFATQQSPAATLSGEYTFQFVCRNSTSGTVLDDFNAFITFGSPTSYTTPGTVDRKVVTSSTLAASPASPVTQGADVTLTATLADAANVLDGGSYQFSANDAPIGSPVAVVDGVASYTASTSALSGPVTFAATFAPTRSNSYRTSTASSAYTVSAVVRDTITALSVTPAQTATTPDTTTVVTLLATVTPSGGTAPVSGTVVFFDGTNELASVAFTDGSASYARTFPEAAYSFTAQFVANSGFNGSTSGAEARTVSKPGVDPAYQDISTTVAAGALTITVADRTVVLPTPVLNTAGSLFVTSGAINPVTVTDTRAGNPGWTASGQLTDFTQSADATKKINGGNLGWTPNVVSFATAQTIVEGAVIAAGNGLEPGVANTTAAGLKFSPRTLASAVAGAGNGTAVLGADLALNVPTSTTAGTYTALLTLTAI